jgi:hypothetical protein
MTIVDGQKKSKGKSGGHGGVRPGSGRPRGIANRMHREYREELLKEYPLQPLEYLLKALNQPVTKEFPEINPERLEAAKAAAPYLHPRMEVVPITMFEALGEGNKFTIDGSKLTDEELETLEKLLTKAQHKPNGNGAAPVNGNHVH